MSLTVKKWSLIALTVALLGAARPDDQPEAKLLLDKAIKAMGDEAKIAKLQTAAAKGTMTGEDKGMETKLSFDASWRGIDRSRIAGNFSFRGYSREILIVINGDQAWAKFDDKVEDAPAEALPMVKNGLHALRIPQLLPSLRGASYKLSVMGEMKVGDRPALGMTVGHKDWKDVSLYFDKESGLPVKSQVTVTTEDGGDIAIEYLYADYKDFNGVRLPSKIAIKADDTNFTMKLEQLKAEEKLEDSLFDKP